MDFVQLNKHKYNSQKMNTQLDKVKHGDFLTKCKVSISIILNGDCLGINTYGKNI